MKQFIGRMFSPKIARNLSGSPVVMLAIGAMAFMIVVSVLTPWIAPYDTYDLQSFNLIDSLLPPVWIEGGVWQYLLGTDDQGRDLLSALMNGLRISLIVGFASITLSALIGVSLGLLAGYFRGPLDAVVMRVAEVQQTFPAILVALLLDGLLRGTIGSSGGYWMVVIAIALSSWVEYARAVRASTMIESTKDYVLAARAMERSAFVILVKHILRNVSGPILVIGTINLGAAIMTEATLSFLGLGVPSTQPSLGTLIRIGNSFLFSGEWWLTLFPGVLLAAIALSINFLGDWLRDILNPRLA